MAEHICIGLVCSHDRRSNSDSKYINRVSGLLRKDIRASEKAVFIYICWELMWSLTAETQGYILKLFLRGKKEESFTSEP